MMQQQPLPPEQRQQILSRAVQERVARHGARIQYADQFSAVLIYGKPVNHVLHLLLTVFLLGLWLIVWFLIAATGGEMRELVSVDEWGRVGYRRA